VTATQWALLSITLLAGAATPGASLALVINTATKYGRLAGIIQSLAHGIGVGFYALLVSMGISSILFASAYAFQMLQLAGGVLLVYLGGKMILGGWQSRHTSDLGLASTKAHSAKALFVKSSSIWSHTSKGFLIVFLNPKIALFFFAVFSQFLHVGQHQILQWTMASLAGVIDALWYLAIAILVSIPSVSNVLNRFGWQLDILWGSVIVAIAAALMINLSSTGL
jgi:threonine/homoserine/homoserine lactone efflux protein